MALTVGTGPFGQRPDGVFNFELPRRKGVIYFEDSPRRVRGVFAGETVVDSRRAKLLHESGHLPVYYFPVEDVRADLLEPTDHSTTCPFKGQAAYWSVRVGDRVSENAMWGYDEPLDDAPPLAGYRAFYWHKLDAWFEEDERVHVHPRDPYHRVDVLDSSRHVRVLVDGEVLAETRRAKALFESGLPTRWYVPPEDVRNELLTPTDTRTGCPYKGVASYWTARVGDVEEEDLAWTYVEPVRNVAPIAGHIAFYNERVDLELDGERQERPQTRWSQPRRRPLRLPAAEPT
jgi:uncharacterized protein (DUF427 family)